MRKKAWQANVEARERLREPKGKPISERTWQLFREAEEARHLRTGTWSVEVSGENYARVHPASKRFHEVLDELGELHDRKQQDYGRETDPFANVRQTAEWGIEPWIGAMVRATDKVVRLQSFVQNGKLANEGVEDSLRDLAVYAIIALVLFEETTRG